MIFIENLLTIVNNLQLELKVRLQVCTSLGLKHHFILLKLSFEHRAELSLHFYEINELCIL